MTRIKKFDPFKNLVLDDYEKELEEFLDKGEFVHGKESEENKKMFEDAAKRHIELLQSKSITLRVNQRDLIRVKAKAKKQNIPYQTLINLLINSYVEGKSQITI